MTLVAEMFITVGHSFQPSDWVKIHAPFVFEVEAAEGGSWFRWYV